MAIDKITYADKCCGCGVCAVVCPKGCIIMQEDDEGFKAPIIDSEKCIECHLCQNHARSMFARKQQLSMRNLSQWYMHVVTRMLRYCNIVLLEVFLFDSTYRIKPKWRCLWCGF